MGNISTEVDLLEARTSGKRRKQGDFGGKEGTGECHVSPLAANQPPDPYT